MNRYIALLRGINVGGHKKILMADLKKLFEDAGFTDVVTYIQSGNVVFSSESADSLDEKIRAAINSKYGWEVAVMVTTSEEIQRVLAECPFPQDKKEKSYFMILSGPPTKENIRSMDSINYPGEEFIIGDGCIYLYSEVGYGKSKLSNTLFERKLKVSTTTRNYRTMMKLVELSLN